MVRKQYFFFTLIVLVAAQIACTFSATTGAGETPSKVVPSETPARGCPSETPDKKLLKNEEDGYCLLYPADATVVPPRLIVINPINAPGDVPGDAWVDISVEAANARTAGQAADAEIAAVGPGFNITRNEVMVDGNQAIVVDGLPGQDSWRRLFVVANDRLYIFSFLPWGQNDRLEGLYLEVVNTLHFTPPTKTP